MKYILLFLLLPLIAAGEGPAALPAAGPKMGPEIEFRGKKQIPSMVCQVGPQAALILGFGTTTIMAGKSLLTEEEDDSTIMAPLATGAGATAATFALCVGAAITDTDATDSYLQKIHANLLPRQAKGELKLEWSNDTARRALVVTYPNGKKIQFTKDPNVVEVKTAPVRPAEMAEDLEFYEKEIFENARAAGLKSPVLDGPWNGGHIHVDLEEAFGNDPLKLKNFLLDYIEHPELAGGVLVKDFYNAPAIDPEKQKAAIEQVMSSLDHWAKSGEKLDIFRLHELAGLGLFGKRSALNINTFHKTLEIRGLRSQKSAAELLRVMRLIQARIKHTNGLPPKEFHSRPIKMKARQMALAFRAYVEESGLIYDEFKDLAPKRLREDCGGLFSRMGI